VGICGISCCSREMAIAYLRWNHVSIDMNRKKGCKVGDAFGTGVDEQQLLEQGPREDDKTWQKRFDKDLVADALFMGTALLEDAMDIMKTMPEPTIIDLLNNGHSNCFGDDVGIIMQRLISCVKRGVLQPSVAFHGCVLSSSVTYLHASLYAMGLCSLRDSVAAVEVLEVMGCSDDASKIWSCYCEPNGVTLSMLSDPPQAFFTWRKPIIDAYAAIRSEADVAIAIEIATADVDNTIGDTALHFDRPDDRDSRSTAMLHALLRRDIGLGNFISMLTKWFRARSAYVLRESVYATRIQVFRTYFAEHEAVWLSDPASAYHNKNEMMSKIYDELDAAFRGDEVTVHNTLFACTSELLSIFCRRGELNFNNVSNYHWFNSRAMHMYYQWMDPNTVTMDFTMILDSPVEMLRDDRLPPFISVCVTRACETSEIYLRWATQLARGCGRFLTMSDEEFGRRVCTNVSLVAVLHRFGSLQSKQEHRFRILTELWNRFWRLGPLQLLMIQNRGMLPLDSFLVRHIMRIFCYDLGPLVPPPDSEEFTLEALNPSVTLTSIIRS
jgi:hypothetical protein